MPESPASKPDSSESSVFEVEQKFVVNNRDEIIAQLEHLGAANAGIQNHSDTYYRHPSRNFAETQEALRIRRIDGVAAITYKGQKLPQADPTLKARKELEWALGESDRDGSNMNELLCVLGFETVTTVSKTRTTFCWNDGELADFCVTVDDVERVGTYAEIELIIRDQSQIPQASARISHLANQLRLDQPERQSYLELLLNQQP